MKATNGERVYVAVSQEGYLVGTLTVWQPEAFIHFLFVDSQYQGQGIGTQLLESLAPWLPFPWKLKCLATNHRALEFYRRRGWKKLETGLDAQGTYFLLGLETDGDDLP
ncbi:GNAT family N-acetyltransferase [Bremerella sp. P1]|uniref:GNAT family N-acetyltransferase n=1 Tax=Bremerella sp. P1 TaxID=3026424 RepID=UPI002367526E|nr:GNAT family N-acetyltransferase [Bremerella sp. P1]WDI41799.1 GNAT family N-acetyltransferase [Bremerella sp. P1]